VTNAACRVQAQHQIAAARKPTASVAWGADRPAAAAEAAAEGRPSVGRSGELLGRTPVPGRAVPRGEDVFVTPAAAVRRQDTMSQRAALRQQVQERIQERQRAVSTAGGEAPETPLPAVQETPRAVGRRSVRQAAAEEEATASVKASREAQWREAEAAEAAARAAAAAARREEDARLDQEARAARAAAAAARRRTAAR